MTPTHPGLGAEIDQTAEAVARYIEDHLFDPFGIMLSGIDSRTDKPFARDFITPIKVPRRAAFDPWTYWTYEDSIMTTGLYTDALVHRYEVTGDQKSLDRARELWRVVEKIYSCSQIHGIGSFLRPYGGYQTMNLFMEPLGPAHASPLFCGLYPLMKHVDAQTKAAIEDMLLKTLIWHEQQNFQYFYYKSMIHPWNVPLQHAASFYLPAIAWAARLTGEARWKKHLEEKLALFDDPDYNLYNSFNWGGDLPILVEQLGEESSQALPPRLFDKAYEVCMQKLSAHNEPGMVMRMCPESAKPGFTPHMRDDMDWEDPLGFAYFHCVHQGRLRPRRELTFMRGLATMGYPGAREKALQVLALRKKVPEDFTAMLSEDHDALPEQVHIYARSVGVGLADWLCNYWRLRAISPS